MARRRRCLEGRLQKIAHKYAVFFLLFFGDALTEYGISALLVRINVASEVYRFLYAFKGIRETCHANLTSRRPSSWSTCCISGFGRICIFGRRQPILSAAALSARPGRGPTMNCGFRRPFGYHTYTSNKNLRRSMKRWRLADGPQILRS